MRATYSSHASLNFQNLRLLTSPGKNSEVYIPCHSNLLRAAVKTVNQATRAGKRTAEPKKRESFKLINWGTQLASWVSRVLALLTTPFSQGTR